MNIKILNDNELSEHDKEQIMQLDITCFGKEGIEKVPVYYFAPTYKHILLFEDQRLVSYLRIVLRETEWSGHKILIGGVGSVETDPKYQGKGYAGVILEEALKILKKQKVDLGLLQTDVSKGAKLYGKIGFIPANIPYEVLDINDNKRIVKAEDVMIAPVNNPQLVEEIMNSDKILFVGKGDW